MCYTGRMERTAEARDTACFRSGRLRPSRPPALARIGIDDWRDEDAARALHEEGWSQGGLHAPALAARHAAVAERWTLRGR